MQEVGSVSVKIVGDEQGLQQAISRAQALLKEFGVSADDAAKKLGAIATPAESLAKSISSLKGSSSGIGAEFDKISTAAAKISSSSAGITTAAASISNMSTSATSMGHNMAYAAESLTNVNEAISALHGNAKNVDLSKVFEAKNLDGVIKKVSNITDNLKELKAAADDAGNSLSRIGLPPDTIKDLREASNSIKSISRAVAKQASTALKFTALDELKKNYKVQASVKWGDIGASVLESLKQNYKVQASLKWGNVGSSVLDALKRKYTVNAEIKYTPGGYALGSVLDRLDKKYSVNADVKLKGVSEISNALRNMRSLKTEADKVSEAVDKLNRGWFRFPETKVSEPMGFNLPAPGMPQPQPPPAPTGWLAHADAIEQAGRRMEVLRDRNRGLIDGLRTAGITAMASTAPIVGLAVSAVSTYSEFNYQLTRTASLFSKLEPPGPVADDLKKITKEVAALSKFTPSEIIQGFEKLAMAGMSAEGAMQSIAPTVRLATIANEDLVQTADRLTNMMASANMRTSQVADAVNILGGVAASTNTNVSELAEAHRVAGNVSSLAGAQFEDLTIALGLMANMGIKGAEAGHGIKLMFNYLTSGSKNAKKALSEMNITSDLVQREGLLGIISRLEEYRGKLKMAGGDTQLLDDIFNAFSSRAGPKVIAMFQQGSASMRKMTAEVRRLKQENFAEVFEKRIMDEMKGSFDKLAAATETFKIDLGETLALGVKPLIDGITGLINEFNNMNEPMRAASQVALGLGVALSGVAFIAGSASLAIGAMIPAILAIGAAKGATNLKESFDVLFSSIKNVGQALTKNRSLSAASNTSFLSMSESIKSSIGSMRNFVSAAGGPSKAMASIAKSLVSATMQIGKYAAFVSGVFVGAMYATDKVLESFGLKAKESKSSFSMLVDVIAGSLKSFGDLKATLYEVGRLIQLNVSSIFKEFSEEDLEKFLEDTRKKADELRNGAEKAAKATGKVAGNAKDASNNLSKVDVSKLREDISGVDDSLKSIIDLADDLGRQLEKMSAGPGIAPIIEIKHTLESDYQSLSDALDKVQKAYADAAKSINENTKLSEQQKGAELASAGGMVARAQDTKLIGEATALGVAAASISKALLDVPLYDFNDTLKESKNLLKQYNVSFDEVIKQMAKSVAQLTSALNREADKLRLGTAVRMLSSEFGGLITDIAQLRAEAGQRAEVVGGDVGSEHLAEAANKAGAMIEGEMLPAIRSLQLEAYETALGLKGVDKVLYDASSAIEQYSKAANLYANAFPELTYEIREYADQLKKAQQQLAAEKIVASFNETSMGMYKFAIESEKTRKHLETLGEAGKVAESRLAKMPKIETLGQALQGLVGKVFDSVMSSLKAEASQDVKTQAVEDISDSIAGAITGSFDAGKLGTAIFNVAMDANKELRNSLLSILGFDVPKVEPVMPKDPRITDYDRAEASLKMFKSSNLAASALEMVSSSAENAAVALSNLTDNILKAGEDSFKRHIKGLGLMSDHREKVISDPGYVEAVSGIEDALKETISSPAISEEAVEALPVSAPQAAMYIPGMPGLGSLMGMVAASVGDLGTAANDAATATTDMADSVEKVADTMASVPEKVSKFESALTGLFGWFKSLFSSGGSAAEKAAGAAVGGSDKIFNDAMSALDGIGEQAAGQDLAADVGMAGASSAAGVATAASALGTALSAIGAGIVGAATAFFALSGPVQALIVGVAGLALALVALQAGAALMYYKFFELSQQTESYKRFQAALEGATDRVVQALEPFWANLMPLAGLFSYTLDVLLPLAAGFANTETIARMLFEVFKVGAIIVAGAMIAIGHFASMMIAGAVAVLNVFAGIVDVFSNMRHIDKMFYNMMLDANAFLLEGLADLIRVFFDLPTAIGNALKAVSGVIIGGIGLVVLGIEFVLSSFYNAILEFASKLLTFVKFVAGIAEALNLAPEGTAEAVQKLINGISGISYNLSDGLGMAIIEGAQNAFQFDDLDGENPISSYMEDVAAGLRDNKEDIPETGLGRSLRDLAGGIQDLSPDLSQMHENFNDLLNLDYDEAKERGNFLADLKETNKEFGEELTNVPQGFKVAAARFRAIAAESMGAGPGRIAGDGNDIPTGTPGNNFYIDMLNVNSDRPMDLSEELEREARRRTLGVGGAVPYNDGINNGSGG